MTPVSPVLEYETQAAKGVAPKKPLVTRVLGQPGDTKQTWDIDNDEEVEAARALYDDLTGKGYHAFKVNDAGKKGEVMRRFDPNAGMIILAPQMAGG